MGKKHGAEVCLLKVLPNATVVECKRKKTRLAIGSKPPFEYDKEFISVLNSTRYNMVRFCSLKFDPLVLASRICICDATRKAGECRVCCWPAMAILHIGREIAGNIVIENSLGDRRMHYSDCWSSMKHKG